MFSHQIPTCAPPSVILAAGIRTAKDSPANSNPRENFAGAGGSACLRPRDSHNKANTGARATTKIGCTNWNQLAGNSQPKMMRLVFRSANRFSEDPACSNDPQKIADATNNTRTAAERFRSSIVQPPEKISQAKITAEIANRNQP